MDGLAKAVLIIACGLAFVSIWFPGLVLGVVFLVLGVLAVSGPPKG